MDIHTVGDEAEQAKDVGGLFRIANLRIAFKATYFGDFHPSTQHLLADEYIRTTSPDPLSSRRAIALPEGVYLSGGEADVFEMMQGKLGSPVEIKKEGYIYYVPLDTYYYYLKRTAFEFGLILRESPPDPLGEILFLTDHLDQENIPQVSDTVQAAEEKKHAEVMRMASHARIPTNAAIITQTIGDTPQQRSAHYHGNPRFDMERYIAQFGPL